MDVRAGGSRCRGDGTWSPALHCPCMSPGAERLRELRGLQLALPRPRALPALLTGRTAVVFVVFPLWVGTVLRSCWEMSAFYLFLPFPGPSRDPVRPT